MDQPKKKTDLSYPNASIDPQTNPNVETSGVGAPELARRMEKPREDRPGRLTEADLVDCIAIAPVARPDGTTAERGDTVRVSRAFVKQFRGQYVVETQDEFDRLERRANGEDVY
jgi:hypothetical protein